MLAKMELFWQISAPAGTPSAIARCESRNIFDTGDSNLEPGPMIYPDTGRLGRIVALCILRRAELPRILAGIGAVFAALCFCGPAARAQTIVAVVNGTPITNVDIEQRIKLLHVLREPNGRDAALQSVVDDNLKLDETNKFKIKASDQEIGQQIARAATKLKMAPEALMAAMRGAGVSEIHIKDHFASRYTFHALMTAYHKGVEVSETQLREELAKEGGKAAAGTEYVVRQIVFAIPSSAGADKITGRIHQAEQLRTRFTDCDSGLPLARGMDDVAVKEEIRRNGAQLNQALKQLLDKTPAGHLTPPQRTPEGVEMVAVCSKSASNDDTAMRATISERLLAAEVDAEGEKKLQELRSHAVIQKK
jgi:peptidyl-prolyl cis-trans isomerase SurA